MALLCLAGICFSQRASAQVDNGMRSRFITAVSDTIILDTALIAPATLQVKTGGIPVSSYWFDAATGRFAWQGEPGTTLLITYRVIRFDFRQIYRHKDRGNISKAQRENPFKYEPSASNPFSQAYDGINFNGNISRSIGFGNSQDLVVNSNLNLQLAGTLHNDIDLLAAISDENNPIQPEGNTQQLQDFDRVFIQLSKGPHKLTAGDFEMTRPQGSYFLNYYKKSRGLQFATAQSVGKGMLELSGEGAISRGRFARNVITAIEGNQGPYNLTGVNGEIFIIVIAGTEAVYLDGERLKRGEQNDYVIDYNTGEVRFNPRRVITRYSRIIVEFQYSDRNYARTVFRGGAKYDIGKATVRLNYFTEQDLKNQPYQQTLNDTSKRILSDVGDSLQYAVMVNETRFTTFDNTRILYRKIDSLGYPNVYVYTTNPADTAFYQLSFSYVGDGNGDYIVAQTSANGRVYQWVDPTGGRKGNYAPVTVLIAPKRQQMVTVGVDYRLSRNTIVNAEWAYSNLNQNTFSSKDKADDGGNGLKLNINDQRWLGKDTVNGWRLNTEAGYEHITRTFRYVERYRPVEFDRQWARQLNNPTSSVPTADELIATARSTISLADKLQARYQFGVYNKSDGFTGLQNAAQAFWKLKRTRFTGEGEWMSSSTPFTGYRTDNSFKRYKATMIQRVWLQNLGAEYETEDNRYTHTDSIGLGAGSYRYDQGKVYLQQAVDTSRWKYRLDYTYRYDQLPSAGSFRGSTRAQSGQAQAENYSRKGNRFLVNVTYRELESLDSIAFGIVPENTLIGRVEYDFGLWKKAFTSNTYYQVGAGQEQRREFNYLEVPAGNGIYAWNDYNGDGIQQLNEFEVAAFKDQARYIRVYVPVAGFIQARFLQLNQTFNLAAPQAWRSAKGIRKVLSRFSWLSNLNLDRKSLDENLGHTLDPFHVFPDSLLLNTNSGMRHTLFFNRADPNFGFDMGWNRSRGLTLLNTGRDSRYLQEYTGNIRWNFSSSWSLNLLNTRGTKRSTSQYFTDRNYDFDYLRTEPRISWQSETRVRLTLSYAYYTAQNRVDLGNEHSSNHEVSGEIRLAAITRGTLSARISYINVDFNGVANSPLGYDMLQGLQNGNNATWNVTLQQRFSKNIQVNVSYDGRKTETSPVIHIGRVEARYIF